MFDPPLHEMFPQVSVSRTVSRECRGTATFPVAATPVPASSPTNFATEEGFGHGLEVIEWKRRWLLSKKSLRTRETYDRDLDAWLAHCAAAGVQVWRAEPHHVDEYRNSLTGAPASVARQLSAISSFYRLVLRRARPCPIVANPAADVERPKVETDSHRDSLNATDAVALRAAALQRSPRTAALVHLLLGTAVRVSEAVNATVSGLGWNAQGDRTLEVVRKGGRPDVVVIEACDWEVIDRYLTGRRDVPGGWLFATTGGRQMTRQTAYRLIRQVADPIAGPGKKIGPHSLRHTVATLALDAGEPIQEVQGLLRHSSSATTQRYDRARRERGRSASRTVARVLGGTS